MTNYTGHYQLYQWEPSDSFLRTDLNQDFARIDTGIRVAKVQAERLEREKAKTSIGACTGDNAASRTTHPGFRPRAVLVEMVLGNRYGNNGGENIGGGLAVDGWPVLYQSINRPCASAIQVQAGDFVVTQDSRNRSYMSYSGTKCHYFTVKQSVPPGIARGDVSI